MKKELQIKIIFVGMLLTLVALLIPLFIIGHYNFLSVDDFGYSETAKEVWDETHSVIKTGIRQISYAYHYWRTFQGTFAAEWFTTTTIGIFGRNAYYMGTYFTLGGFVICEIFLFMVILKKILDADFFRAGIISVCIVGLQILLTPVPVEAFYWFCGAVLYTVTFNNAVLLTALLILLYYRPSALWKRVLLYAGIVLLTVMVSGGTYGTLIPMLLLYFCAAIWYWYRRNPGRWFVTAGAALYLTGFLLNVLAPGNQLRLSAAYSTSDLKGNSAVTAILLSLKEAAFYIAGNATPPCLILGVLLLPLFAAIVKRSKYKFPFPLLITLFSFGAYASQFTPTLYTLGITGPGRILNLYRWTLYIWLYGNELYWLGWLFQKKLILPGEAQRSQQEQGGYLLGGWIAGGILLCIALYVWGGTTLTSVSAVHSLYHKEAQTYYAEYQERLSILEDESVTDACLEPFSSMPYLLFFGDIAHNSTNWVNTSAARYFGKNSVVLTN